MPTDPELTPVDVEQYSNGMLSAEDPETARILTVALAVARRDVRWFVSPARYGVSITLNGTGTDKLRLPTRNVINLTSITSDGVAVDLVNNVVLDCESGNLLVMNTGRWSNNYNGVVVTMDHGFPGTVSAIPVGYSGPTADDWRQAILSLVVNISQISILGRPEHELASKTIDDTTYSWRANEAIGSMSSILDQYRLLRLWV